MQETDPRIELVHRFFSGTGPTYDRMARYATFGLDNRWKQRIVDLLPPAPSRILDLACGTGISTLAIARRFPRCHVTGVELREEYLAIARDKLRRLGLSNVDFVLGRAEDYRSSEPLDCIVSSYLAKYADLPRLIPAAKAMLKDGGLLLLHDFTYPYKAVLNQVWRFYFWTLQRVGTSLFPAWREIYYGLPRLIRETRWIPESIDTLYDNGFQEIQVEHLTAYSSAIVTAWKQRVDPRNQQITPKDHQNGSHVLHRSYEF